MTLICLKSLSNFFEDAVRLLNVKPDEYYLNGTRNLSDPLETAFRMFEKPSKYSSYWAKYFSKPETLFL